jgi:hypothetical protein
MVNRYLKKKGRIKGEQMKNMKRRKKRHKFLQLKFGPNPKESSSGSNSG